MPEAPASIPNDLQAALAEILRELKAIKAMAAAPVVPELLDLAAAAQLTSISPRLIDGLLSSGRFPQPERLGRLRLWRRSLILAWIDQGMPARSEHEARLAATRKRSQLEGVRAAARAKAAQGDKPELAKC